MTDKTLALLAKPEFPLSQHYQPEWMLENQMGPNALWLVEWLCQQLDLAPGSRVLDLGCGRGLSSVFLARELQARVWAADLWMSPDHNWRRAVEAGVEDRVYPLRVEAHALPFACGFFDAVVSIDAYQYFGTDELYLSYLTRFVRPGGSIGVVVPGIMQPFSTVPAHLTSPQRNGKRFWEDECWCFHTADWWRELWDRSTLVRDVRAEAMPDGWRHWRDFELALESSGKGIFPSDAEAIDQDGGRFLGLIRVMATRTDEVGLNHYDPALGVAVGLDS